MKKITVIITALALCLAFSSCSKKKTEEQTTQVSDTTAVQETETQSTPETEPITEEQTTAAPEPEAPTAAAPQSQKTTKKPTQAATKAAPAPTAKATTAKATTAAPAPTAVKGFEGEMLEQCNRQRRANGKGDLKLNNTLCANAAVRAEEISRKNCFSHTRPDGSACFTAITVNFMTCGENIAYGTRSVSATVSAWMNSPGHKANILSDDFTEAGFGCYEVNGVRYWVQLFIG